MLCVFPQDSQLEYHAKLEWGKMLSTPAPSPNPHTHCTRRLIPKVWFYPLKVPDEAAVDSFRKMGWEIHRLWLGGRHQHVPRGESIHLFSSLRTFERRCSQAPLTSSPILSPRCHHDAPLFPTQIPRLHDSAPDVFRTLRLLRGITTSTTLASTVSGVPLGRLRFTSFVRLDLIRQWWRTSTSHSRPVLFRNSQSFKSGAFCRLIPRFYGPPPHDSEILPSDGVRYIRLDARNPLCPGPHMAGRLPSTRSERRH